MKLTRILLLACSTPMLASGCSSGEETPGAGGGWATGGAAASTGGIESTGGTTGASSTMGSGGSGRNGGTGGAIAEVGGTGGAPISSGGTDAGGVPGSSGGLGASGGNTSSGGTPIGSGGGQDSGGGSSGGTASGGAGGDTGATGGVGPDTEPLIGWASVPSCGPQGTTGGGDGEPTVTVTNAQELEQALLAGGPRVISVSGRISAPEKISSVRDKTLIGQAGAEITGGITLENSRNVIIRNILFSDGSGGAGDTFELSRSECFWFDHCEFRDGSDGNLDIVRASDFVTVSWSKFYYTRGHDHMLSNLNGNGDDRPEDEGKINITFHHNWWGAGVRERMPRVRYGKVHVFNNYYKYEPVSGDSGQNYCIAAGQHANLLVESNYFDGSRDPIIYQTNGEGTAQVTERNNEFVGTSGTVVSTGGAFTPPYDSAPEEAATVKSSVTSGAGVH